MPRLRKAASAACWRRESSAWGVSVSQAASGSNPGRALRPGPVPHSSSNGLTAAIAPPATKGDNAPKREKHQIPYCSAAIPLTGQYGWRPARRGIWFRGRRSAAARRPEIDDKGEDPMTIELAILAWGCVLALVYIWAAVRVKTRQYGVQWNIGPRDEEVPPPQPIVGRLARAQANFFETFPLFV